MSAAAARRDRDGVGMDVAWTPQLHLVGSSFSKPQTSCVAPGKQQVHINSPQIPEKSLLATGYSPFEKQKLETTFSILISEVGIFKYLLDLHSCKGVSTHL